MSSQRRRPTKAEIEAVISANERIAASATAALATADQFVSEMIPHPPQRRVRVKPPTKRPTVQMEPPSIWQVGNRMISPPRPQTQQEFDGWWWAYHKDEPFSSMPEQQWRAIGAYLRECATAMSFNATAKLHRRRTNAF